MFLNALLQIATCMHACPFLLLKMFYVDANNHLEHLAGSPAIVRVEKALQSSISLDFAPGAEHLFL